MPKPYILKRPAGWYARFFVPVALHASLGSRYVVLSLRSERGDGARFTAARIGYVLSRLFEWMRKNAVADPKDLLTKALDAARNGRELVIDLPDGTRITTDGSAADYDAARSIIAERERVRIEAGVAGGVVSSSSAATTAMDEGDLLSLRVEKHLAYLRGQQLGAKNIMDSEYSLGLFIALMGDKTIGAVVPDDIESYLAMLVDYPRLPTVAEDALVVEFVGNGRAALPVQIPVKYPSDRLYLLRWSWHQNDSV